MFAAVSCPAFAAENEQHQDKPQPTAVAAKDSTETLLAGWPERPLLGARQMIAKYGAPEEMTDQQLVWHNQGPYKRITVTKAEDHHDFPLPHMDYMEHTISYKVPAEKADELMKFDGSVTFDKTRGEMSARCDLEGHNILTLNLANDIVTGKSDAEEARVSFGRIVADDMAGKYPPYTTKLQFEPAEMTKDSDKPTISGAPVRAMKAGDDADKEVAGKSATGGDAEILSILLALDTNEVIAMIDGELLKTAENDALKKHLTETRGHIAMHLEKAKEIQGLAKN